MDLKDLTARLNQSLLLKEESEAKMAPVGVFNHIYVSYRLLSLENNFFDQRWTDAWHQNLRAAESTYDKPDRKLDSQATKCVLVGGWPEKEKV